MILPKGFKPLRAWLLAALAAVAVIATGQQARAAWPEKPIHLIIPFAAGGPSDVLGRAIGQKISVSLNKPVLVENKPGAGTNLAADSVAKSAPDGYTLLLMMVGTQAINEAMYPKLSYDTVRDFAPVTLVAASSLMLVANPAVPARNFKELVALAKARPDKYNFGSSGSGTPLHLGGELLNNRAGIRLMHVPYKGAAPALNDVLGGQIELAMIGTPSALQYIKSGKLTAIGVTSAQRTALAPEVPTLAESVPGYEVELVYAIVAPAGTPKDVVTRLNADIGKALGDAELRDRLLGQGFEVRTSTPEQLGSYIRSEIGKWAPIVKATGVKPE